MNLDPNQSHTFLVTVHGCTAEEAEQVIAERTGYDEDYGFDYQLSIEGKNMNQPVSPVTKGRSTTDTIEYRVEHQHIDGGLWHPVTQWSPEWPFREGYYKADDERVVARRVSAPWEVTDE